MTVSCHLEAVRTVNCHLEAVGPQTPREDRRVGNKESSTATTHHKQKYLFCVHCIYNHIATVLLDGSSSLLSLLSLLLWCRTTWEGIDTKVLWASTPLWKGLTQKIHWDEPHAPLYHHKITCSVVTTVRQYDDTSIRVAVGWQVGG